MTSLDNLHNGHAESVSEEEMLEEMSEILQKKKKEISILNVESEMNHVSKT